MNALNRDLKKLVNFIEKNEKERVNKDYWRLKFHLMIQMDFVNLMVNIISFISTLHLMQMEA